MQSSTVPLPHKYVCWWWLLFSDLCDCIYSKELGLFFFYYMLGIGLTSVPGSRISLVKNWRQETDLTGVPLSAHNLNCLHKRSAWPRLRPQIFMLPVNSDIWWPQGNRTAVQRLICGCWRDDLILDHKAVACHHRSQHPFPGSPPPSRTRFSLIAAYPVGTCGPRTLQRHPHFPRALSCSSWAGRSYW